MKNFILIMIIMNSQLLLSQQYDSVFIEKDSINSNNLIYKPGNVFIYDYEIIENGKSYKLDENSMEKPFKLVPIDNDSVKIDKIHLIVRKEPLTFNPNQTRISYFQRPIFLPYTSTGVVENEKNIWIHPIREGFFKSLETCPFPYIKTPAKIGNNWEDEMLIGNSWANEKWGQWSGKLLLKYFYFIKEKKIIFTPMGKIECYVIESHSCSRIGKTKLVSYFSEKYGFIRLEYELSTGINVNFWLFDFLTNKEFNSMNDYFKTKSYIKN